MLGLGVIVPPCMYGLTAVKVLAWMFSPTRRRMLMPSTGMGVFCYSQTDAYALDGHVTFSLIQRWMLMPCGIFGVFAYSAT